MSALLHKCSFTTPVLHWYKLGPFSYLLNFVEIKPKYLLFLFSKQDKKQKYCHRFDEKLFSDAMYFFDEDIDSLLKYY